MQEWKRDSEHLTGGNCWGEYLLVKLKRKEKQKKKKYNPNKESKYSKVYKIDKRKLRKKLVEKLIKPNLVPGGMWTYRSFVLL